MLTFREGGIRLPLLQEERRSASSRLNWTRTCAQASALERICMITRRMRLTRSHGRQRRAVVITHFGLTERGWRRRRGRSHHAAACGFWERSAPRPLRFSLVA